MNTKFKQLRDSSPSKWIFRIATIVLLFLPGCGGFSVKDLTANIINKCFNGNEPTGRRLTDSECECVTKQDPRPSNPGVDLSNTKTPSPDPRLKDTEYAMWTDKIRTTRCGCCHNSAFKGAGSAYWDMNYKPVWWDSVSDRRLMIMSDKTSKPGQTLPFNNEDMAKFKAFVEKEIKRREALRTNP